MDYSKVNFHDFYIFGNFIEKYAELIYIHHDRDYESKDLLRILLKYSSLLSNEKESLKLLITESKTGTIPNELDKVFAEYSILENMKVEEDLEKSGIRCSCGHKLSKFIFFVRNEITNAIIPIGSICILKDHYRFSSALKQNVKRCLAIYKKDKVVSFCKECNSFFGNKGDLCFLCRMKMNKKELAMKNVEKPACSSIKATLDEMTKNKKEPLKREKLETKKVEPSYQITRMIDVPQVKKLITNILGVYPKSDEVGNIEISENKISFYYKDFSYSASYKDTPEGSRIVPYSIRKEAIQEPIEMTRKELNHGADLLFQKYYGN